MLNQTTDGNFEREDISEDIKSVIKCENHPPVVDPSLVQITANKAEIDRRIAAFLRKKQLDVDIHNQREFCNLLHTENGRYLALTAMSKKLFSKLLSLQSV